VNARGKLEEAKIFFFLLRTVMLLGSDCGL
jgi:hypothetical protein